ncbi:MAG TPA: zinc ribbon domain-containing protein [candidate division Zixibacteria bacterium]|nr:zinc ribbon domain-containing protein [candidate division Zixibacteria bacterium]MDD4917535.1 zinc ribbon domain-containing protein [candidate division Zixibacteria bacterium]MDM7972196.1 zinc ribbon domain-containing protein [candidate division Zixibacteria bacterium]HOD67408.1 zinc ribbon domain-containing protein [candidate division Zixibacteria bacterium]HOZ06792.1 zinc ribbon domain-containing protein [candidate division Zixibacteria bacterium]
MPIYEFKCGRCAATFEELVSSGTDAVPCPKCGSADVYRLISLVSSKGMSAGSCAGCAPSPAKCRGCSGGH